MKSEPIKVLVEPGRGMWMEKITPRLSRVVLPQSEQVIFWNLKPIALYDTAGYIYLFEGIGAAARGLITKHWGDCPVMIVSTPNLDYILGQALSKAGLMLVRRLDP